MKTLIRLIVVLIVAALLLAYGPYYVNTCHDCGKTFFGPGYEVNIVVDVLSEEDYVICRDCAEIQHAITSLVGKSVDDYQRPWLENPIALLTELFND